MCLACVGAVFFFGFSPGVGLILVKKLGFPHWVFPLDGVDPSSINLGSFLTQLAVTVSGHLFVCAVTLLKFLYVFVMNTAAMTGLGLHVSMLHI